MEKDFSLNMEENIIRMKESLKDDNSNVISTLELLKEVHDYLDDLNSKNGNLCLICGSDKYDGNGIIHLENCLISKLRKKIKELENG